MREMWNHPLGRHLIVILLVKLVAIFAIWWVFFRPLVGSMQVGASRMGAVLTGPAAVRPEGRGARFSSVTRESVK